MISKNVEQTFELGKKLGARLKGGDIVCLNGDLGAGKTVFIKGVAKGLGVKEEITSPTFSIMNIYEAGDLRLCHYDVYRIESEDEGEHMGLDEYFGREGNVCVIEWSDNIKRLLTNYKKIEVVINKIDEDTREIELSGD